jgi:methylated-DNA-protein-cysteine methyltransferase related protein
MTAVYRLVRRIPRGAVLTYGEIAGRLGRPGAARAVGHAMRVCPADIPWHRVVNARGGISVRARASGMVTQRIRLEQEGVAFRAGRVILARHRWREGMSAASTIQRRRTGLRRLE